ncbi:hypothetical protein NKG94_23320 [Micromonospora sp. M12]
MAGSAPTALAAGAAGADAALPRFHLWRAGGGAWAWWLTPAVVFGLIPVIDLLLGDDRQNPPEEAVPGCPPTATTGG